MTKPTRTMLVLTAAVAGGVLVAGIRRRRSQPRVAPANPATVASRRPSQEGASVGGDRSTTPPLRVDDDPAGPAEPPGLTDAAERRPSRTRRFLGLAVVLAVISGWFFFLRPAFLGGPAAYVLVSGNSMLPTLEDGDLVVAIRRDRYETGDIAVYRIPEGDVGAGGQVIHRIVGGSAQEGYLLRGDNRETNDLWRPTPDDIQGELWLRVPEAGKAVPLLRSPLAMAAFAGFMAFLFIYRSGSDEEEETTNGQVSQARAKGR